MWQRYVAKRVKKGRYDTHGSVGRILGSTFFQRTWRFTDIERYVGSLSQRDYDLRRCCRVAKNPFLRFTKDFYP